MMIRIVNLIAYGIIVFTPEAIGAEMSSTSCLSTPLPKDWALSSQAYHQYYDWTRVFEKNQISICCHPGAGSTWFRHFLNKAATFISTNNQCRINMNLYYNDTSTHRPHGPPSQYRHYSIIPQCFNVLEEMPLSIVHNIGCDSNWYRYAIVRNPYAKLLSKYNDKIIVRKEYHRSPFHIEDGLNFSKFIIRLSEAGTDLKNMKLREEQFIDPHFRRGKLFCGSNYFQLIYIHYEKLKDFLLTFLKQLGLENEPTLMVLLNQFSYNPIAERKRLLLSYQSPNDVSLVRLYYEEEFRHFGYTSEFPPNY